MSLRAIRWAWDQPCAPTPKLVLLALAECVNDRAAEPLCWPGQERLAQMCKLSVRQVRRVLTGLVEQGVIAVEHRPGHGKGRLPDVYRLRFTTGVEEGRNQENRSPWERSPIEPADNAVQPTPGDLGKRTEATGQTDISGPVRGHSKPGKGTTATEQADNFAQATGQRDLGKRTEVTGQADIHPTPLRNEPEEEPEGEPQYTVVTDAAPALIPDSADESRQSRFAEFWAVYPRKVGRKPAWDQWCKHRLDRLADVILTDIGLRQIADRRWLAGYIPNPLTYLAQERWEDAIEVVPADGPSGHAGVTPGNRQTALENANAAAFDEWERRMSERFSQGREHA